MFHTVKAKRRYHHGALRQALIDEGFRALERDGLEALSLRALAASTGVSKTAPYRHFTNRQELLRTLAAEGFGALADTLEGVLAGPDNQPSESPNAELRLLLTGYIDFAKTRPALYRLMFSRLGFSLHSEKCRVNSERTLACLVRAVERARTRGWRARQETNALVLSLWAQAHGWAGLIIEDLLPSGLDKDPNAFWHLSESLLE
jgi:AcrR family transcriptional regulator